MGEAQGRYYNNYWHTGPAGDLLYDGVPRRPCPICLFAAVLKMKGTTSKQRRKHGHGRAKSGPVRTYSRKKPEQLILDDPFSSAATLHFPLDSSDPSSSTRHVSKLLSHATPGNTSRSTSRRLSRTPNNRTTNPANRDFLPPIERPRASSVFDFHRRCEDDFLTEDLPSHLREMTGAYGLRPDACRNPSAETAGEQASLTPKCASSRLSSVRSLTSMELTGASERSPSLLRRFQNPDRSPLLCKSPLPLSQDIFRDATDDCPSSPDTPAQLMSMSVPSKIDISDFHSPSETRGRSTSMSRSASSQVDHESLLSSGTRRYSISQSASSKVVDDGHSGSLPRNISQAGTADARRDAGPIISSTYHSGIIADRVPDPEVSPIRQRKRRSDASCSNSGGASESAGFSYSSLLLPAQIGQPVMCSTFAPTGQGGGSSTRLLLADEYHREPVTCSTRNSSLAQALPPADSCILPDDHAESSTLRNASIDEMSGDGPVCDSWKCVTPSPAKSPARIHKMPRTTTVPCPLLRFFSELQPVAEKGTRKGLKAIRKKPFVTDAPDMIECAKPRISCSLRSGSRISK